MVELRYINVSEDGLNVCYDYVCSRSAIKYFRGCEKLYVEYDVSVKSVPEEILVIPFLANFLPIAWFAGLTIVVGSLDKVFYEKTESLRSEFVKMYPSCKIGGRLIVKSLSEIKIDGNKKALFFNGGVDAFASFVRYNDYDLELITILGTDIEVYNHREWKALNERIDNQPLLKQNEKFRIKSNFRTFYNYKVDLLCGIGWWDKVQFGMATIGSAAPLSYVRGHDILYFSASTAKDFPVGRGSTPTLDEKMVWSDIKTVHSCYDLNRQQKIESILEYAADNNRKLHLSVCYSELRNKGNCSICEKCFQTILGIIVAGVDPNDFGFAVTPQMYEKMLALLLGELISSAKGNWTSIFDSYKQKSLHPRYRDLQTINFFEHVINNKILEITTTKEGRTSDVPTKKKLSFILRNRYPKTANHVREIYKILKRI